MGWKARSRSGRRPTIAEAEVAGETERDPWRVDTVAGSRLDLLTRYG